MYEGDILVLVYPNKKHVESIMILDPYDKKTKYFYVNSDDELKHILLENLPFCDQGHQPLIHGGHAILIGWNELPEDLENSKNRISSPDDIEKALS